jgi:hypothetical protein
MEILSRNRPVHTRHNQAHTHPVLIRPVHTHHPLTVPLHIAPHTQVHHTLPLRTHLHLIAHLVIPVPAIVGSVHPTQVHHTPAHHTVHLHTVPPLIARVHQATALAPPVIVQNPALGLVGHSQNM